MTRDPEDSDFRSLQNFGSLTISGDTMGAHGLLWWTPSSSPDDFEKNLRRFASKPIYRGIRISHNELTAGLKGNLVERCNLLIDLNLTLDVNGGPDMPADVTRLAAALPKLRIVTNHAANLRIDGKEPPGKWCEGMEAAAKQPNVFCKVSALVEQTGQKQAPLDVDYYRPVLDTLRKNFGEDRLIFGSNWPVSDGGAPFATVVGIVRDYFTAKGGTCRRQVFLRQLANRVCMAKTIDWHAAERPGQARVSSSSFRRSTWDRPSGP